jgi:hypothetical protein
LQLVRLGYCERLFIIPLTTLRQVTDEAKPASKETAETVIGALEDAEDYKALEATIIAD